MWRNPRLVLLSSCAIALAAGAENGTNATLTSEEHVNNLIWWTHPYEVYHLEEVTIVMLVVLTLLVDAIQHKLAKVTRSQFNWVDELDKEVVQEDHRSREPMPYLLYSRGTAEFTVLGIIACIVWICERTGGFDWLHRLLEDVNDIALPIDGVGYHHNTESVHMHLFVTFALYYSTMACSIFVAGYWMRSWAASPPVHRRQMAAFRAGKDCCEEFVETDWKPEYVILRQTFLNAVVHWRKSTDHLDRQLHQVSTVESDSISGFLKTRFPFTPYMVENYRDMLENMVLIQLKSLACLGVVEGLQALVHRLQVDFDFTYIWIGVFALVLSVLYFYTRHFHGSLKQGHYLQKDLKRSRMARMLTVPERICALIQICFLLFCFEMTRPIAHSYAWILDRPRSWAHSGACVVLVPVAGLLLGHLLAQLAVVLSCSPDRPVNEARLRLIWERHQMAKIIRTVGVAPTETPTTCQAQEEVWNRQRSL